MSVDRLGLVIVSKPQRCSVSRLVTMKNLRIVALIALLMMATVGCSSSGEPPSTATPALATVSPTPTLSSDPTMPPTSTPLPTVAPPITATLPPAETASLPVDEPPLVDPTPAAGGPAPAETVSPPVDEPLPVDPTPAAEEPTPAETISEELTAQEYAYRVCAVEAGWRSSISTRLGDPEAALAVIAASETVETDPATDLLVANASYEASQAANAVLEEMREIAAPPVAAEFHEALTAFAATNAAVHAQRWQWDQQRAALPRETEEELALRLEFNERYIAAKEQGQFDIPQEVWDRASDLYTALPVEFREAFDECAE